MNKLKPILMTGIIAVAAVYVFKRFIGPRIGISL